MQIKTTRYHLILTRAVMIKMVVSVGKVMKTPIHCWWGCKVVQPVLGKSLAIIQRAKHKVIILSSNSTNLEGKESNLKEGKPVPHKNLYTNVHSIAVCLCNPIDCSPPGFSVHAIFPARMLEVVATSSSRGIFLSQRLNPCLRCLQHW